MNRATRFGWWALIFSVVHLCGCSNLVVHKVPLADREAGTDHAHGFRYYLPRPYVLVHDKIIIYERRTLVVVDKAATLKEVSFLDGPRRGQAIALEKLKIGDQTNGTLRQVSIAELQQLRTAVALSNPAAASPDQQPDVHTEFNEGADAGGNPGGNAGGDGQPIPIPSNKGKFEIVFMPDLDEQYVVKSRNFLAKTAFRLTFKDGADLTHVGGDHDATTLAVEFLNTIDSAIQATQSIAEASAKGPAAGSQAAPSARAPHLVGGDKNKQIWVLVETVSIKPGLYRLNKPWELQDGYQPSGNGLLAQLGLPSVVDVALVAPPKKGNN
jgi:hypothetical protein